MKRAGLSVVLLLAAGTAGAVDFGRAAIGTTGSEFLLFDTSARGIGLGGAMTAVTDDAASIYWNPAGLAKIPRLSATFMHSQYAADISYEAASYAQRVNDASVLGLGVRYLDGGSIVRTDINGASVGTFHPRSYVAEAGWGQSVYDLSDSEMDVSMGVTAKMIRTELGLASASGFAMDLGVISRFYSSLMNYDVGVAVQNLGRGQRFGETRDTLPTRVRFGGAIRPVRGLTLSLEGIAPINDSPYGAAGAEYSVEVQRGLVASARAGVDTLTYQSLGTSSTLRFGMGVKFNDLSFDYAFVPMGVLDSATHRISVSFNLPAKISRRYRER